MTFSGKRVLVTGGARGIGAAIVKAFTEHGAHVAVNARTETSIEQCRQKHGFDYIGVAGEIGSREICFDVVHRAVAALGGLDILITNAGIFHEMKFEDVTQQEFDTNMNVNLGGVFFCAQAAMPALKESTGNIVAIASDAGLISYSGAPAYSASKGAVVSLVKSLAIGYANHSIRVNCVCPGSVETDMITNMALASTNPQSYLQAAENRSPLHRMGRPEEIAGAVLYLASKQAGFTTGVALPVDGGGVAGFD